MNVFLISISNWPLISNSLEKLRWCDKRKPTATETLHVNKLLKTLMDSKRRTTRTLFSLTEKVFPSHLFSGTLFSEYIELHTQQSLTLYFDSWLIFKHIEHSLFLHANNCTGKRTSQIIQTYLRPWYDNRHQSWRNSTNFGVWTKFVA